MKRIKTGFKDIEGNDLYEFDIVYIKVSIPKMFGTSIQEYEGEFPILKHNDNYYIMLQNLKDDGNLINFDFKSGILLGSKIAKCLLVGKLSDEQINAYIKDYMQNSDNKKW